MGPACAKPDDEAEVAAKNYKLKKKDTDGMMSQRISEIDPLKKVAKKEVELDFANGEVGLDALLSGGDVEVAPTAYVERWISYGTLDISPEEATSYGQMWCFFMNRVQYGVYLYVEHNVNRVSRYS